jgi:hypothetical protein
MAAGRGGCPSQWGAASPTEAISAEPATVAVAHADLCRSAAAIADGLRCRVGALGGAKVSVPVGAEAGALVRAEAGTLVRAEAGALVRAAAGTLVRAAAGTLVRAAAGTLVRTAAGALVGAEGGALVGAEVRTEAGPLIRAEAGVLARVEAGPLVRAEDRDGLRCRAEARDTYGPSIGRGLALDGHPDAGPACPAASGVRTPRGSGRRDHRQRCSSRTLGAAVDQPAPQGGHRAGNLRKWPRMTRPRRGGAFIRAAASAAAAAAGPDRRSRRWR